MKKKLSDIFEGKGSSLHRAFLEATQVEKKRSDICIVCGFNPKDREKSIGCYYFRKKISNRHQYIYYG